MTKTCTVVWIETTSNHYWEMLECLPPAYIGEGGFLVGEPTDHRMCAVTGRVRPRFGAFLDLGDGKFWEANRPLTVPEFCSSNRPAVNTSERGRLSYERDVARRPNYHDGAPRKAWEQLGALERSTWMEYE